MLIDRKCSGYRGKPIALVLTATIVPHLGVEGVARCDPAERLQDYIGALRFYLSLPDGLIDRIIFLENSGSNLSKVEESVTGLIGKKRLEFLSFTQPPGSKLSKESGEFRLLEAGIRSSELLGPEDLFLKVTGRLTFRNLDVFLRGLDFNFDLMCDLHNVPLIGHGMTAKKYMDLRVFFSRVSVYKTLFFGLTSGDSSVINASSLYSIVLDNMGCYKIIPRFPTEALLAGIGARHNKNYDAGLPKLRRIARASIRRMFPSIWL